eukprot:GHVR01117640.1.p1 GENE.GHVR01117640.1~~GHVR01117640.1.p1  ORF type:complete len:239 (+),score=13.04 GHVR01117640.1:99-815(+)
MTCLKYRDGQFIKELKYSQDSVKSEFFCGRALVDTFKELISGVKTPKDIPPIEVVLRHGSHWVFRGNRRLLLYKLLVKHCDNQKHVFPVIERELLRFKEFFDKKSTINNGKSVTVRGLKISEFNLIISNIVEINNADSIRKQMILDESIARQKVLDEKHRLENIASFRKSDVKKNYITSFITFLMMKGVPRFSSYILRKFRYYSNFVTILLILGEYKLRNQSIYIKLLFRVFCLIVYN